MSWWHAPWTHRDSRESSPQWSHPSMGGYAVAPRDGLRLRQGTIGEECEAFLTGRAVASDRGGVPLWLPLSWIAHGDSTALAKVASGASFPSTWRAGAAYLAAEVLARTGDPEELLRLQRGALVPLELELLARRLRAPQSVGELVDLVVDTMRRFYQVPT